MPLPVAALVVHQMIRIAATQGAKQIMKIGIKEIYGQAIKKVVSDIAAKKIVGNVAGKNIGRGLSQTLQKKCLDWYNSIKKLEVHPANPQIRPLPKKNLW